MKAALMPVLKLKAAQTAHPTGDPSFAVKQCMPAVISEEESDPFLMCDEFGPSLSKGACGDDTDEGFDVAWHPHHGMEILSYIIEGRGRHADSMGNRETFSSPGFQWISVGSGIEHAEGGGTPAGERTHGFQIWLRMPKKNMEDDPRYGTVNPADIPMVKLEKGQVRVLAGSLDGVQGPARYAVTVQILDVELQPGEEWTYSRPDNMDNVIFYAFKGSAVINGAGQKIKAQDCCRFDTGKGDSVLLTAGSEGYRMIVFTGKMTKEKILWQGPFVCADRNDLMKIYQKYQRGDFPPKRVNWDYRDVTKKPR